MYPSDFPFDDFKELKLLSICFKMNIIMQLEAISKRPPFVIDKDF